MYYRNWCKTIIRVRAFPLSSDLVKGMAAVAFTERQPRLGVAFLLSFLGLLRVSELLHLRVAHLKFFCSNSLHLVRANTKGAQLKGSPELAQIFDPVLIAAVTS